MTAGNSPHQPPGTAATPATGACTPAGFAFTRRRKRPVIANVAIADVAIARELAGWCWSLAVMD